MNRSLRFLGRIALGVLAGLLVIAIAWMAF